MTPSRLIGVVLVLAGGAVFGVEVVTPPPAPDQLQRTIGRLDSLETTHSRLRGPSPVLLVGGRRFVIRSDSLDEPALRRMLRPGADTVKIWSRPSRGGGMVEAWQVVRGSDIILSYSTRLASVQRDRSQMKVLGIVMVAVGLFAASGWSPSVKP